MKSLAAGNRVKNEVAQGAGITSSSVGYYLARLNDLRIIERHYPATVDPDRSRKGRYKIADPLFRFWFRFVYGRTARYEVYGEEAYADLVEPELPAFVSGTFEQLCQRAVLYAFGDEYRFVEEPGTGGMAVGVRSTSLLRQTKTHSSLVRQNSVKNLSDTMFLVNSRQRRRW
ncbi:DUF234 domain-containing protein [Halocatena marina]|uniref:DUF234 domain-containing protein n=1 Tax=Halocatena marina TaxID=2934937 RepID=UPI0036107301